MSCLIHQCMPGIEGERGEGGEKGGQEGKCHVWKDQRQIKTFVAECKCLLCLAHKKQEEKQIKHFKGHPEEWI